MKRLFLTFLAFAVVMAFTPMTAHATLTTDLAKITSATTHSSSYNSALKRILSGASGFAVLDDQVITFGDDGNWTLGYDETTDDNLELTTAVSGTDLVIDIAGGNADGEDIVIGAHNMNVSAAGAVIFGQASTVSTVTDTALTLRGGDTGTAAGEDVVLLGDNIAFTAGGAGTFGQNTTWTTDAGFTYTIAADDGATEGEDVIITGNNWRITAAGVMTFFNNAGSIATLAGTALTLTGGDDGGAAGEDIVLDADNIGFTAAGVGTYGQATTWTTDAGFSLTLAADDASVTAEDVIITGANFSVDANGLINQLAGETLTLTGGDDGGAAGEDVVIDGHNWSMSAAGAMVLPTTSSLDIIDVAGFLINSVANASTMDELNRAADTSARVITLTATGGSPDITLSATQDKALFQTVETGCNGGQIINLPAATGSGIEYTIIAGCTNAADVVVTADGAYMFGVVFMANDSDATVSGWEAGGSTNMTWNGTTKGGTQGDVFILRDIAANVWSVSGWSVGTGSEATPFS